MSTYTDLAEIPIPSTAEFIQPNVIRLTSTFRDHTQNRQRTLAKHIVLSHDLLSPSSPSPGAVHVLASTPYEELNHPAVLSALSPSGRWRVNLVDDSSSSSGGGGAGAKRRIEIWEYIKEKRGSTAKLRASKDVSDAHGPFYADEYLASSSFSFAETGFVYTAEANPPRAALFPPSSSTARTSDADPYAKYRFKPHFGEGLVGKRRPTLFIATWAPSASGLDVALKRLAPCSPSLPPGSVDTPESAGGTQNAQHALPVLFGQAVFAPADTTDTTDIAHNRFRLYATGYEYLPDGRLLGVKGCYDRPTGIWELVSLDSKAAGISGDSDSSEKDDDDDDKKEKEKVKDKDNEKDKDAAVAEVAFSARKLSEAGQSTRSPRVLLLPPQHHHNGSAQKGGSGYSLVWVGNPAGGPHATTSSLYRLDFSAEGELLAAESRPTEVGGAGADFSLAGSNLLDRPFVALEEGGGYAVVAAVLWGSRSEVSVVPLGAGHKGGPIRLTGGGGGNGSGVGEDDGLLYSWSVLAVTANGWVVAVRSMLTHPFEVVLGRVTGGRGEDGVSVKWADVIDKAAVSEKLAERLGALDVRVLPIPGRAPTETIVLGQKAVLAGNTSQNGDDLPPLISWLHGGPHATTTTAFNAQITGLALEGYTMSLPNYTGSLGFGRASVLALIGNCGTLDVGDCIASTRYVTDELKFARWGKGRQFVIGGSHGGFLTAHLIGQYPDIFSAAVLRNPVISAGESSTTDITDWGYAEFGLPYPLASRYPLGFVWGPSSAPTHPPPNPKPTIPLMTAEHFKTLREASPISYIEQMRTPVLLLVGAVDLRVPPMQGTMYYHALRERLGEDQVGMLVFEADSHPLEGVEAGRVGWEAGRDWFKRFRV